ncbi:MAG: hypothetical protein ACTHMM_12135 [Agriterribacter sp.]
MNRALPIYTIEGTDFIVDVANLQLREKENAQNTIKIFDMSDLGDRYVFHYNPQIKNIPEQRAEYNNSIIIEMPELVKLDPQGMSEKYNVANLEGKNDFEVMVDQDALHSRIKLGKLPTIDIAGHTFYADARIDLLRPKDDFMTMGIKFSEIQPYFFEDKDRYIIPYNPKTHEFQEPDYDKITQYPKDLLVIEFPHERILDPVGWNRYNGFSETYDLKETGLKLEFKARIIPWNEIGIDHTIQRNIKKLSQQKDQPIENHKKGKRPHRRPKL